MKKILIISPHFPPVNTPDHQRVRMSLPFYKKMGWQPIIMTVDPKYIESKQDELLSKTISNNTRIITIRAFKTSITRKIGLGSLSLRALFFYFKHGNKLLKNEKVDLIFFSTTAFHVCWLGSYWKRKFGIPFIIDFQDPWRNDFYLDKPKNEQPPKFALAYAINKWMEAKTVPFVDGLISVSEGYIKTLKKRYPQIKNIPSIVLPFGATKIDFDIVDQYKVQPRFVNSGSGKINVVYIGATTKWFLPIIKAFFKAFQLSINNIDDYRFYFIGTSYANAKERKIEEIAKDLSLDNIVFEYPERIPYFNALATLQAAQILFIPGSLDVDYNASKVYNNILSNTPIFSIFNKNSEVKKIIESSKSGVVVAIDGNETENELSCKIVEKMEDFKKLHLKRNELLSQNMIREFSAESYTKIQVDFFDKISKTKLSQ